MTKNIPLKKLTLNDLVQYEFNKGIYKFYHEMLTRKFNVQINNLQSFYLEVYKLVALFYYNYEDIPYEVDAELKNKLKEIKDDEILLNTFKFYLVFYILTIINSKIERNQKGKKSVVPNEYCESMDTWTYIEELFRVLIPRCENLISKKQNIPFDFSMDIMEPFYHFVNDPIGDAEKALSLKTFFKTITSDEQSPYLNQDNSESSQKITDKVIYLNELGIIDFLAKKEPFNLSTNSLAKALSLITGESQQTLQSYLNPIINNNANQKNNPLNNHKKLDIARENLIKLGFKINTN
ncbi:hypothetical protein PW52_00460 [Tamlana sedimentorum]|uniref:Uncharacterized protein n=1 Tax=Neotamlana sedimentorum TaxID=1435349 RepID=A0A0D7WGT7_9FLAO|nr:hypothetical protein [Tamlana sedimentorum]KJD36967.1 hypothetical protein PW52_00460 [Tamlana sedimentorum]